MSEDAANNADTGGTMPTALADGIERLQLEDISRTTGLSIEDPKASSCIAFTIRGNNIQVLPSNDLEEIARITGLTVDGIKDRTQRGDTFTAEERKLLRPMSKADRDAMSSLPGMTFIITSGDSMEVTRPREVMLTFSKIPRRVNCEVELKATLSNIPGCDRAIFVKKDVAPGDLIFSIPRPMLSVVS